MTAAELHQLRTVAVVLFVGVMYWRLRRLAGRSPIGRKELELLRRARELQRRDPAAARALVEAEFGAALEARRGQLAELWTQAPHDRAAAERLRALLREELATAERRVATAQRSAASDPAAATTAVEHATQLREELARVESWLRQMPDHEAPR